MAPRILSFEEALGKMTCENPHLLLGNGFSIAWKPVFNYQKLYTQALQHGMNDRLRKLFKETESYDFEILLRHIRSSVIVVKSYAPKSRLLLTLENDYEELKEILVTTIASNHPDSPNEITESEYSRCLKFLSVFKCKYTLNYDLLLYWTLMHGHEKSLVNFDDGFRTPDSGKHEYVTWEVQKTDNQNLHYLHGALHLFDAGAELMKYTWVNTGVRLIDQIRTSLGLDYFPLFVSEGTTKEKQNRIFHHNYLSRGFRSFSKIGGTLFIFGHSLATNDDHILRLIAQGKVKQLFISMYGDSSSQENQFIRKRTRQFGELRNKINEYRKPIPLDIYFFDAESARVWR